MTISEMHLSVKNQVNKLATTAHQNLSPEQIDLLLNRAQDMFIKQRYENNNIKRKGLEESQKRIDDLRVLLNKPSVPLSIVSVEASGINGTAIDTWNTVLPADYMFLVESETYVYGDICEINDVFEDATKVAASNCTNQFQFVRIGAIPTTATITFQYSTNAGVSGTLIGSASFTNYSTANIATVLSTTLATTLSAVGGINFTVVAYPTVSYPYGFVVQADNMLPTGTGIIVTITIAGIDYAQYYNFGFSKSSTATQYKYTPGTGGAYIRSLNQHVQHDDLGNVLRNSYAKPFIEQPVIVQEEDFIYIYTDGTYIPIYEYIVYLRKPVQMSITTLTNCELPYHTHNEIIDIAVQAILEIIESVRVQSHQMETLKQE